MSVFNYKILLVTFVLWEKLLKKFTVKMWPKHVCFSAIIYQKRIGTSSCITVLYNLLYILFHITGLLWCFMFSRDLNELFIKKKRHKKTYDFVVMPLFLVLLLWQTILSHKHAIKISLGISFTYDDLILIPGVLLSLLF